MGNVNARTRTRKGTSTSTSTTLAPFSTAAAAIAATKKATDEPLKMISAAEPASNERLAHMMPSPLTSASPPRSFERARLVCTRPSEVLSAIAASRNNAANDIHNSIPISHRWWPALIYADMDEFHEGTKHEITIDASNDAIVDANEQQLYDIMNRSMLWADQVDAMDGAEIAAVCNRMHFIRFLGLPVSHYVQIGDDVFRHLSIRPMHDPKCLLAMSTGHRSASSGSADEQTHFRKAMLAAQAILRQSVQEQSDVYDARKMAPKAMSADRRRLMLPSTAKHAVSAPVSLEQHLRQTATVERAPAKSLVLQSRIPIPEARSVPSIPARANTASSLGRPQHDLDTTSNANRSNTSRAGPMSTPQQTHLDIARSDRPMMATPLHHNKDSTLCTPPATAQRMTSPSQDHGSRHQRNAMNQVSLSTVKTANGTKPRHELNAKQTAMALLALPSLDSDHAPLKHKKNPGVSRKILRATSRDSQAEQPKKPEVSYIEDEEQLRDDNSWAYSHIAHEINRSKAVLSTTSAPAAATATAPLPQAGTTVAAASDQARTPQPLMTADEAKTIQNDCHNDNVTVCTAATDGVASSLPVVTNCADSVAQERPPNEYNVPTDASFDVVWGHLQFEHNWSARPDLDGDGDLHYYRPNTRTRDAAAGRDFFTRQQLEHYLRTQCGWKHESAEDCESDGDTSIHHSPTDRQQEQRKRCLSPSSVHPSPHQGETKKKMRRSLTARTDGERSK